jgi:hypothetical protein
MECLFKLILDFFFSAFANPIVFSQLVLEYFYLVIGQLRIARICIQLFVIQEVIAILNFIHNELLDSFNFFLYVVSFFSTFFKERFYDGKQCRLFFFVFFDRVDRVSIVLRLYSFGQSFDGLLV